MSKHRIFIAIPCSDRIRGTITAYQERWRFLPVRWTAPRNLHLTLLPPVYLMDDEIAGIIGTLRAAVSQNRPFDITFKNFTLAPPGKPPRMIWLEGEPQPALTALRNAAATAFPAAAERRALTPHITIARMHPAEWKRYSPPDRAGKPDIAEAVKIKMPIEAVAVMESILHRNGAEYSALELIPLSGNA